MTLRVNTNIPAINSHRNLILNNTDQARTMERLSSGLKINRGADGPAALVISERLRAQTAGLEQAIDNSEAGISLVQTAEGALNEMNAALINARQLAGKPNSRPTLLQTWRSNGLTLAQCRITYVNCLKC